MREDTGRQVQAEPRTPVHRLATDAELDAWKAADSDLIDRGMRFIDKVRPDLESLVRLYWGPGIFRRWRKEGATDQEQMQFLAWLWLDWRAEEGGPTLAEQMIGDPTLDARQSEILSSHAASHMSVYQVVRLDPGNGVELEDILSGQKLFVHDHSLSLSVQKWLIFFGRLYSAGPYRFITGIGGPCPPAYRDYITTDLEDELADYRKTVPGAGWADLLRNKAHILGRLSVRLNDSMRRGPELRNTDDDPFVLCQVTARLHDPASFAARIEQSRFERGGHSADGIHYVWLKESRQGTVVGGRIVINGDRLVLECNSRKRRSAALRKLRLLGDFDVLHVEETTGKQLRKKIQAEGRAGSAPAWGEDFPEREAIERQLRDDYYQTWLDQSIPALGGSTPRKAAKTPAGRQQLTALLRAMEYSDACGQPGQVARFDWNRLRRQLGINPE